MDERAIDCRWIKNSVVLAVTLFFVLITLVFGFTHFSEFLNYEKPKLNFYQWVWPRQSANHKLLSEFEYCVRPPKQCQMLGPRLLIGTFSTSGKYVSHLSAQDTFDREKPIGLVWRLEALISPYLAAKEIKSVTDFYSDLKIPIEFLVIDYDSPSRKLAAYADWINELSLRQLKRPVSATGLVSWSIDNPDGFRALVGALKTLSVQLYHGPQRVLLNDNLVSAIERYDNVHISLYCPDPGLLDYFFKKVSINRPLNIGIFNGSGCDNLSK